MPMHLPQFVDSGIQPARSLGLLPVSLVKPSSEADAERRECNNSLRLERIEQQNLLAALQRGGDGRYAKGTHAERSALDRVCRLPPVFVFLPGHGLPQRLGARGGVFDEETQKVAEDIFALARDPRFQIVQPRDGVVVENGQIIHAAFLSSKTRSTGDAIEILRSTVLGVEMA